MLEYILSLYYKILPLYIIIIVGVFAGKLKIERQSIVNLLIYIINPAIFFHIGLNLDIDIYYIFIPIISFILSSILCLIYYNICNIFFKNQVANLIAFGAGASNCGYFGLPIAIAFLGESYAPIYMIAVIGVGIYEYTLGAYIMERGHHSAKTSIRNVLKIPIIHGLIVGLIFNKLDISLSSEMNEILEKTRHCYVVLGLMMVGLALSAVSIEKIKWRFVSMIISARLIVSPAITLIFVYIDLTFCHFYPKEIDYIILIISIMPPAVNTIFFATMHNNHYTEAAVSVLLGLVLMSILMPFFMYYVLMI